MTIFTLLQLPNELVLSDLEVMQKVTLKLFFRLAINFISVSILIRGLYFSVYRRKDLFFTFYTFNLVIFLICFLLNKVDISMGAAFGLFAVFSMLRYKTEEISIKDMSYLFLVIAIGLINAISKIKGASDYYEYLLLVFINGFIILMSYLLEKQGKSNIEVVQTITYDKLELVKPENQQQLIEDIRNRTGINVHRTSIGKIDLAKNTIQIKIYYYEK